MNKALLHKDVRRFISENFRKDIPKLIFKGSPFAEVTVQELAAQLTGKKKAEKKLPLWFENDKVIYPPLLNLEQTSSQTTAMYKASLINGESLLDLTGGFGIDTYFFSKRFEKVVHCELNSRLSEIAAHNFTELDAGNIDTFTGDGMEFLVRSSEKFSWIYVDPSRRDDSGGRVFRLSDCLPNVPENLNQLINKAEGILVKTSPLLDLQAGILELGRVQEIHVVAVENEVKELLWLIKNEPSGEIKVRTINFGKKKKEIFDHRLGVAIQLSYSPPLTYLYEPNAAIMKSGLMDQVGESLGLEKLHQNSHLYTSREIREFPGRRFEIMEILPFNRKKMKRRFDFEKAHITTRNFPETVVALRKQLKLKDGGNHYLFFTTTVEEDKVCLVCRKC